ncbi:MAG: hypothetical protein ACQEVA_23260 [Myxococcota bacterium]
MLVVLAALLLASGCSVSLDEGELPESKTEQAREHLLNHRIDEAQSLYAEALAENPTYGDAAAGKALTDLLLIAQAASLEPFWTRFLGADATFDADRVLYAHGGIFYWMSKGVPWEDSGDYAGIRSLIAERLPWPEEKLASLYAFTRGLDRSAKTGLEHTVALADGLAQVERQLRIALDDPELQTFVLPGEVFHAEDVGIAMGRAELAALSSAVSFARGLIYLNAAYAHDWTPEGAVVDAEDDDQRQIDHAVGYLDMRVFRTIDTPRHLDSARASFAAALRSLRESVDVGSESTAKTAIDWRRLSSAERDQLRALLTSTEDALDGPTAIPYTEPQTSMDLSGFFEEGRALPAQDDAGEPIYWMVPLAPEDDAANAVIPGWKLNDDALQTVFVDGVFEPSWRIGGSNAPQLQISGNVKDDLVPTVAGELNRDVQKTY